MDLNLNQGRIYKMKRPKCEWNRATNIINKLPKSTIPGSKTLAGPAIEAERPLHDGPPGRSLSDWLAATSELPLGAIVAIPDYFLALSLIRKGLVETHVCGTCERAFERKYVKKGDSGPS